MTMTSCKAILERVEAGFRAYENESARISTLTDVLEEGLLGTLGPGKARELTEAINTAKTEHERASSEVTTAFEALDANLAEGTKLIEDAMKRLEQILSGNQSNMEVFQ